MDIAAASYSVRTGRKISKSVSRSPDNVRRIKLRSFRVIVKLSSIQPIEVLVIDRTTAHVVNPTWQDGLQVALKLWVCAVLHITFSSGLQEIDCSIETLRMVL